MKTLRRVLPGMALAALAAMTATAAQAADDPLPASVLQALAQARLPPEALAVAALPLHHLDRAYGVQATRSLQPGSSMKLVTSIVALERLGPNHRGFTELRSAAPPEAGVLAGPLVLRGGGDPELGIAEFWALLLELRQAGVRHIAGDLVVDRTRWRPHRLDRGVPPFDEAPEFPYNVIPDALGLAGSLLPLELRAGADSVLASTVPALQGLQLDSTMALVDAPCADWDDHWQPALAQPLPDGGTRLTLTGAFPRGCTVRAALQLLDRQELTERLFRTLWAGLGGTWAGRALEPAQAQDVPAAPHRLARRESRPWGELLRRLNKSSDNEWTRILYLELGVVAPGSAGADGDTRSLAGAAVRRWFEAQGIATDGLVLDNGSGLSRSERISPLQMAQLVRTALHSRHAPDFWMSLPTVGVDGTMRNRLKDSPATGWARLKTGTLRNVVALAGVAYDDRMRPWAVSMVINHDEGASRGRPVLDALVDHWARHGVHPVAAVVQGEGP